MTVQSEIISLTSSEASIAGNDIHGTLYVTVRSLSGTNYIGPTGLTSASGYQLDTGGRSETIKLSVGEQLFGYSTSGDIAVLRNFDTT